MFKGDCVDMFPRRKIEALHGDIGVERDDDLPVIVHASNSRGHFAEYVDTDVLSEETLKMVERDVNSASSGSIRLSRRSREEIVDKLGDSLGRNGRVIQVLNRFSMWDEIAGCLLSKGMEFRAFEHDGTPIESSLVSRIFKADGEPVLEPDGRTWSLSVLTDGGGKTVFRF